MTRLRSIPPVVPELVPELVPGLSADDVYLFNEGSHLRLYDRLGAQLTVEDGQPGVRFGVWAPDAESVSVVGDFCGWNRAAHRLAPVGDSGLWSGFVGRVQKGDVYKFHVRSRVTGQSVDKADPFAFYAEPAPKTASIVWDHAYEWHDAQWMTSRGSRIGLADPVSIYEVHLGSWRRGEGDRMLGYREIAQPLADYARAQGFTHVELMPIMEHPFYGSWGYQTTGYFAPTSRYGSPQDFMYLVEVLHQAGIGVILDWVPSHFPTDEHGLNQFDGTHLFEHADPRQGFHPDWKSSIFNYGRREVQSFLLSSAMIWLDRYHIDGIRVDAVASMLYLDYSRKAGEWIPNQYGGRENLEALSFLRRLNTEIYTAYPDVQTFAEESTAWPGVSRPTYAGGLGFGLKWDMGWMHDTLRYLEREPVHRAHHQSELTFRMIYAFQENFMLPLSHDEVVHGKGSLLDKMPGDTWQRFANLRLLYAYMFAQPGKKLLFMGAEIGQWSEWNHDTSLSWHLMEYPPHQGIQALVRDLNRLYTQRAAMHELDCEPRGFEWVDASDSAQSVLSFLRKDTRGKSVLVVLNLTPVPRSGYRVGVPEGGRWAELLNTDAAFYGGTGVGNLGGVEAQAVPCHGRSHSVELTLPPLGALFLAAP